LLLRLLLDVGDPRTKVFVVDRVALSLEKLQLLLQLRVLVREPLRDLLAAEGELARAIREVEDGERVFGGDLASNSERSETRGGNRTTSFVARNKLDPVNSKEEKLTLRSR
jgi:hypothetical protein